MKRSHNCLLQTVKPCRSSPAAHWATSCWWTRRQHDVGVLISGECRMIGDQLLIERYYFWFLPPNHFSDECWDWLHRRSCWLINQKVAGSIFGHLRKKANLAQKLSGFKVISLYRPIFLAWIVLAKRRIQNAKNASSKTHNPPKLLWAEAQRLCLICSSRCVTESLPSCQTFNFLYL